MPLSDESTIDYAKLASKTVHAMSRMLKNNIFIGNNGVPIPNQAGKQMQAVNLMFLKVKKYTKVIVGEESVELFLKAAHMRNMVALSARETHHCPSISGDLAEDIVDRQSVDGFNQCLLRPEDVEHAKAIAARIELLPDDYVDEEADMSQAVVVYTGKR